MEKAFEKYRVEAQEKWGNTEAYKEHVERTKNYSGQKWNELTGEMDRIMAEFALCMKKGEAHDSAQAQNLVKSCKHTSPQTITVVQTRSWQVWVRCM